jgi:hypothetical protein
MPRDPRKWSNAPLAVVALGSFIFTGAAIASFESTADSPCRSAT